jgi:tetratricopeptide (TPR) repeat protein
MTPHTPPRPKANMSLRARQERAAPAHEGAGESARPSRLMVWGLLTMCAILASAAVTAWRAGLWEPVRASAAASERASAQHASIRVALDAARSYMAGAEWGKAEAILREAAQTFPLDQEIRIALGETLLGLKRYADSYEQYAKALMIGPRDAKLEFTAGQVASNAELHESAADHFFSAHRADPFNASYPLMQGMVERRLGRSDAAKASFLRAANIDPQNAFAWGSLADIALAENNVNLAVQHITKARQLQPESREWRLIEARARKRLAEPERALMLLQSLETSQRTEPSVIRLMAECYGMLNRHADAAEVWAAGLGHYPTDAAMAFEAALSFERAGNKSKAMEFARRAHMLGHEGAARVGQRLGGS